MATLRYTVRRLFLSIITLIGVSIMTFFLTWVMPGDPAHAAAGRYATPEQVEAVSERLGLDKPLPVQYVRYMGRLLQGDLGKSLNTRQSVAKEFLIFAPASLELAVVAMSLAAGIGVSLGALTATGNSPRLSSVMMLFSYIGVGLPEFWLGLMLQ
ncbi:MAG: ABC transporter permease, partial [Anaerolineales bacterium]